MELSICFILSILFVISEIVHVISVSCLLRAARCLESKSPICSFSVWITKSISPCKFSPCSITAAVNFWEFVIRVSFWTVILNTFSWYFGKMKVSRSSKSFWMTFFWLSKYFEISTNAWPLCSLEDAQVAQIEILHYLQWSSHIFVECFGHLVANSRLLNVTTLCSVDSSKICSHTHTLHRCKWQMPQNKGGPGDSQIWHRKTSWPLHIGSMAKHYSSCKISCKK